MKKYDVTTLNYFALIVIYGCRVFIETNVIKIFTGVSYRRRKKLACIDNYKSLCCDCKLQLCSAYNF